MGVIDLILNTNINSSLNDTTMNPFSLSGTTNEQRISHKSKKIVNSENKNNNVILLNSEIIDWYLASLPQSELLRAEKNLNPHSKSKFTTNKKDLINNIKKTLRLSTITAPTYRKYTDMQLQAPTVLQNLALGRSIDQIVDDIGYPIKQSIKNADVIEWYLNQFSIVEVRMIAQLFTTGDINLLRFGRRALNNLIFKKLLYKPHYSSSYLNTSDKYLRAAQIIKSLAMDYKADEIKQEIGYSIPKEEDIDKVKDSNRIKRKVKILDDDLQAKKGSPSLSNDTYETSIKLENENTDLKALLSEKSKELDVYKQLVEKSAQETKNNSLLIDNINAKNIALEKEHTNLQAQLTKASNELVKYKQIADETQFNLNDARKKIEEIRHSYIEQQKRYESNIAELTKELDKYKTENKLLRKNTAYLETIAFKDERNFLSILSNNAKCEKLVYKEEDLLNFHMSIKSSTLTILEGMSGTGKSRLVRLYAETLGLGERFKVIPVSPGWTDDIDILGYLDPVNNEYKEATTKLVSLLIEAQKPENSKKLFIVCLDEMNLAKVEHYFAQFLSILEHPIGKRVLTLYSSNACPKNADLYPAEISIGQNVVFCGTVNVDESTCRLSDKVLDRSTLIRLTKPSIKELMALPVTDEKPKMVSENFIPRENTTTLSESEINLLHELDILLTKIDPRFGLDYRVISHFNYYISSLPKNIEYMNRQQILELLIIQKMLPKLRGTKSLLQTAIGEYSNLSGEYIPGTILNFFEAAEINPGIVSTEKLKTYLEQKARELNNNGYIG